MISVLMAGEKYDQSSRVNIASVKIVLLQNCLVRLERSNGVLMEDADGDGEYREETSA